MTDFTTYIEAAKPLAVIYASGLLILAISWWVAKWKRWD